MQINPYDPPLAELVPEAELIPKKPARTIGQALVLFVVVVAMIPFTFITYCLIITLTIALTQAITEILA